MRRFTQLYLEMDETTRTNEKVAALHRYFEEAPERDAAWALFFLTGQKLPRAVSSPQLRQWAAEEARLPAWLFEECYDSVGDLAETAALVLEVSLGTPQAGSLGSPGSSLAEDPAGSEDQAGERLPGSSEPPGSVPSWSLAFPGTQSAEFLGERGLPLHRMVEERLVPLRGMGEEERRKLLVETWTMLEERERYVWNKLITGEFRVGVARTLVARALAGVAGVDPAIMAHRLMGQWRPTEEDFSRIMSGEESSQDPKRPYPFYLAYPLEVAVSGKKGDLKGLNAELEKQLGAVEGWQAEWKWDGIRAQLIRRGEDVVIWSRGEDLITDRFPEIADGGRLLPEGTVLDGEILAWQGDRPLRFGELQRRITVKNVSKKLLAEVPAAFMAYDILEFQGEDIRPEPLEARRARLEEVIGALYRPEEGEGERGLRVESNELPLKLSPVLRAASWSDLALIREESRENDAEGLMLKRLSGPYLVGRVRGDWWKWKVAPFTVDAVLIYAQPGHGKRANLFTDYTFGLWRGDQLVPVAKAYSGLTDAEIKDVDAWIRQNTVERFGPVRTVRPELVFEIAFEGIQKSTRHKSGVAVRFPRILRWRHDKHIEQADTLEALRELAGLGAE